MSGQDEEIRDTLSGDLCSDLPGLEWGCESRDDSSLGHQEGLPRGGDI